MSDHQDDPMVHFTQYLRPDGRPKPVSVERTPEVAGLARLIYAAGGRLEIEVLTTGDISMTVETDASEQPIAIEVCPNGPPTLEAVDRLVRAAASRLNVAPGL